MLMNEAKRFLWVQNLFPGYKWIYSFI